MRLAFSKVFFSFERNQKFMKDSKHRDPILENNGMPLSIQKKLICKESGMP
jgi:hypothetical protein